MWETRSAATPPTSPESTQPEQTMTTSPRAAVVEEEEQHVAAPFCRAITSKWRSAMDSLRYGVLRVILAITNHVASHPISYVVGISIFSFALLVIGLLTNFDMSLEAREYTTPVHSVIREQWHWIEEESDYPLKPQSLRILVHRAGENVLTTEGVSRTFDVLDKIQQTEGYLDFCEESKASNTAGYGGICHIRGMPLLWNQSRTIFEESVSSQVDLLLQVSAEKFPDGSDIEPREIMGHMTTLEGTHGERNIIETAESFLMEVSIPATLDHSKDLDLFQRMTELGTDFGSIIFLSQDSKDLAIHVLDELQELKKAWADNNSSGYHLEIFLMSHSLESETLKAVYGDLPLIPAVFVIMGLFTCLVFTFSHKPGSKNRARFLLGFGAVATILISMATSYGFLFIVGVPFTSLCQILPFIMFGIGLDDAFIIYGEYVRTDETKDPVDRIRDTFEEIGLSIFLTTVTTTLAFMLGCFASVPLLVWLSAYAFPTVLIDFIYQITFFVAIIVIDERRIAKKQKNEEEKTSEKAKEENQSVAEATEPAQTNNIEPETENEELVDHGDCRADDKPEEIGEAEGTHQQPRHHHVPGPPVTAMDRCMKRYADLLLTRPAKIAVLLGFFALTTVCAVATSRFTQEFNIYEVLMDSSYVSGYFSGMELYAETGWILPKVYFRNVDQADPDAQQQMMDYLDDLVNNTEAITTPPPFFWLKHFKEFLTYDDRLLDLTFNQQLDIFLSIDVFRMLYGDHIVRDNNGDIVTSRVPIYMDNVDVDDVNNQIMAWRQQLDVTEEQPINSKKDNVKGYGFNFFLHDEEMIFTCEFYAAFVGELITSSVLGVVIVTAVTFLFLPHWSAPFILGPIISVLYIDLIGFLQLCGVHLNAITYFTLVMSIGLLVDFNMHILLRYYESPFPTREAKVKDALQTMGSSVVIGGLSTFLGVVPLMWSTSSFMKTLFYGFWGMVLLGCGHGVIVLPVILSYIGPVKTCAIKNTPVSSIPEADPSSRSTEDATNPQFAALMKRYVSSPPSLCSRARPHLESESDISGASYPKQVVVAVSPNSSTRPHLESNGDVSLLSTSQQSAASTDGPSSMLDARSLAEVPTQQFTEDSSD